MGPTHDLGNKFTDRCAGVYSYLDRSKEMNKTKLQKVMNGLNDIRDIAYLKVQGQNQFIKEVQETIKMPCKILDIRALHRNDFTHEVEGTEPPKVVKKDPPKKETPKASVNKVKREVVFKTLQQSK